MQVGQPVERKISMPPLAWLFTLCAMAITIAWFVHALGYWEDDAYIHLEFARSLATDHGFAFNGRVVYGDTSPLWVLLLAAFHAMLPSPGAGPANPMDPHRWIVAGKTLCAIAAIVALTGIFRFSRSLVRGTLDEAASNLFAATMLLMMVLGPYFGYWAFSGMEALAAAGLIAWTLTLAAPRVLSMQRFLGAALLAGLAPVLRPEISFFTLLAGLLLLARLVRMPVPFARKPLLLLAGLVLIAAPTLAWARYALRTFGMVVPNTNAAKRAMPNDPVVRHLAQIYLFGYPLLVLGAVLLAGWLLWSLTRGSPDATKRSRSIPRLLPASGWLLLLLTGIDGAFYIADHTYVQTRYIFVTAPLATIALLALARMAWQAAYRPVVGFGLVFGVVVSALSTWPLVSAKKRVDRIYADLAAYMATLPPSAAVAHYSIGEAAFLSQHTIIDTGGITRPGIIPLLADPTDDRRTAWIYGQGAQYEVIDHQPVAGATLVWSRRLPGTQWRLHLHADPDTDWLMLWKLPPRP